MIVRHRANPPRKEREVHRAAAIFRFQKWDNEMIRLHGQSYHHTLGYPIH